MSCEFINDNSCRGPVAVNRLRSELKEIAEGFSAKELRDLVCQDDIPTIRIESCLKYQSLGGKQ